jgi:hypothetical protein
MTTIGKGLDMIAACWLLQISPEIARAGSFNFIECSITLRHPGLSRFDEAYAGTGPLKGYSDSGRNLFSRICLFGSGFPLAQQVRRRSV